MKYLVLHYTKSKTVPEIVLFNTPEEMNSYIESRAKMDIVCYEYTFSNKYSIEKTITKSTEL